MGDGIIQEGGSGLQDGGDDGYGDVYRAFFEAMLEGGIAPLVETAHDLLGYPLGVLDETGYVVLLSPDAPIGVPIWDEWQREGANRYGNLVEGFREYRTLSMPDNQPTVIYDQQLYDGNQIATIFYNGSGEMTGGAFLFLGDQEPTDHDMRVMEVFSKAAKPEMDKLYDRRKDEDRQLLIACDRGNGSYRENVAALSALGNRYGGDYRIIYAEATSGNPLGTLPRVQKSINGSALDATSVLHGQGLVVLAYQIMPGTATVDHVVKTLSRYQVAIAVSTQFDDIYDLADHLVQARSTLTAGRITDGSRQVFDYEDVAPLQPFALCAEQTGMSVFVHPAVKQIIAYDKEHGTEWIETLEAYLHNRMNKTRTAEALGIHWNTLVYRLGRMEELFGIDFDDQRMTAQLTASLWAARFA